MRKLFAVLTITVAVLAAPAAQASEPAPSSKAAARQINSALRWDAAILMVPRVDRMYASFDLADQARRAVALSKTVKGANAREVFASVARRAEAAEVEAQFGDRLRAAGVVEAIAAELLPLFAKG
jgi:hypothetical protein